MPHYNVALLGFGNVGQSLATLLHKKQPYLASKYGITFTITGIATGKHGIAINQGGVDVEQAINMLNNEPNRKLDEISEVSLNDEITKFIDLCRADVLFENTPVNYVSGQPAFNYIRQALESGIHVVTANKGPVVHGFQMLTEIAQKNGVCFYFESAVMDGAPIFSLFRETLPTARILSFQGILNSTTNMILTRMEFGESFEKAIQYTQAIGIAETDPSGDIDGWDAAVKVSALVTVLMGVPIKPVDVNRIGIRDISLEKVRDALEKGERWKLICAAERVDDRVVTQVKPVRVTSESPFYEITGTSSILQFKTDVLGKLSIIEQDPGPETTAYGCLADFVNAVTNQQNRLVFPKPNSN